LSKENRLPPHDASGDQIDLDEYVALKMELDELKKQQGIQTESKLSRFVSSLFEKKENREKVKINKKKHLWTAILLGWAGGHRFQAKQPILGALYLLTCWSGFSMAMTIIDIVIIIPMQPDEDGNILV